MQSHMLLEDLLLLRNGLFLLDLLIKNLHELKVEVDGVLGEREIAQHADLRFARDQIIAMLLLLHELVIFLL